MGYSWSMANLNLDVQEALIEIVKRISELEALTSQADTESERRSLRLAIAELRQIIKAHAC